MGSQRLPGKVLSNLAGTPMLLRHLRRVSDAQSINDVVVATTTNQEDDAIVDICKLHGWNYFRGDGDDVLERYYCAAREYNAEFIVRVTADCPMIDPEIIDRVAALLVEAPDIVDYASNVWPDRTFPRGLDAEIFSFDALAKARAQDSNTTWREHVTVYIQRHPELFTTRNLLNDIDYSDMRWTVDTPEDLRFARKLYEHFCHDRFSWRQALALVERRPDWTNINRNVIQKVVV